MAWNACAKQQASWVCCHSPGLHSASLLLSLSLRESQCTKQEQKRWGINRSWRTKCATKSRSHTTATSHTHMHHVTHLSSAACIEFMYPEYCFFAAFRVRIFHLIRQRYNMVTKRVSVGNVPAQTSKGGGMDSWTKRSEETILRVLRARVGFNSECVLLLWEQTQEACCFAHAIHAILVRSVD